MFFYRSFSSLVKVPLDALAGIAQSHPKLQFLHLAVSNRDLGSLLDLPLTCEPVPVSDAAVEVCLTIH
jgi:hypothetical protein